MSEAVIGLIGVVVGGLITSATQFLATRRSERSRARTAARLVAGDFRERRDLLARWLEMEMWLYADWEKPPHWEWDEHRADLATALSPRAWEAAEQAHRRIRHTDISNDLVRERRTREPGNIGLNRQEREITERTIEQISEAIEALRPIARLRKEKKPLTIFAGLDTREP